MTGSNSADDSADNLKVVGSAVARTIRLLNLNLNFRRSLTKSILPGVGLHPLVHLYMSPLLRIPHLLLKRKR